MGKRKSKTIRKTIKAPCPICEMEKPVPILCTHYNICKEVGIVEKIEGDSDSDYSSDDEHVEAKVKERGEAEKETENKDSNDVSPDGVDVDGNKDDEAKVGGKEEAEASGCKKNE